MKHQSELSSSFLIDLLLSSQQVFCQQVSAKVALNYWDHITSSTQLTSEDTKDSWGERKGKSNGFGHKSQHKQAKLLQWREGRYAKISNKNPQNIPLLSLLFSEQLVLLVLLKLQKPKEQQPRNHNNKMTPYYKWILNTNRNKKNPQYLKENLFSF